MKNKMEIEITINGITRRYKGDPDEMQNKNWNETLFNFIEDITL